MIKRLLRQFWLGYARPLSPQEVKSVVSATPIGAAITAFNAVTYACVQGRNLEPTFLCSWLSATILLSAFIYSRSRKARFVSVERVSKRAMRRLKVTSTLLAMPWAILAAYVVPIGPEFARLLALVLCAGMMTSASVMLQRTPAATVAYLATVLIGIACGCLALGTADAVVTVVYSALLSSFLAFTSTVARTYLFDKDRAVDGLSKANDKLKTAHEQLRDLALRDPVTGLSNRQDFQVTISAWVREAERNQTSFSLLILDLDNFKNINDSYGHKTGDEVLKCVGSRLASVLCPDCFLARLGGDEFAVLARFPDGEDNSANLANAILAVLSSRLEIDGRKIPVAASIGCARFGALAANEEALLLGAGMALTRVKSRGKGVAYFLDDELNEKAKRRQAIAIDLLSAIENGELEMHYQPQFDLITGEIEGAEALLRWNHAQHGHISPETLFEIANERAIVGNISAFVFEQVQNDLKIIKEKCAPFGRTAINVHAQDLRAPERLLALCDRHRGSGLSAEELTIEITEGCFVGRGSEGAPMILDALADRGYLLSLDDFGTGFAALSHLRKLSVREIKIDKSFVAGIAHLQSDRAIVSATIAIAHGMGLRCVAEGVETPEQLEILWDLGVQSGQGYYWSKPLKRDEFIRFLDNHRAQKEPAARSKKY